MLSNLTPYSRVLHPQKPDYRALQRISNSSETPAQAEPNFQQPMDHIVGGTKKKSYKSGGTSANPGEGPRKRGRKASNTAVAVVAAGSTSAGAAIRIKNGEIRPLRKDHTFNEADEEDFEEFDDNPSSDGDQGPPNATRGLNGSSGGGGKSRRSRRSRSRSNDNHDRMGSHYGTAPPSNGGTGIPQGCVGGPSKSMEKDELNHIIPESKKFPQVRKHFFCI